MKKKLIYLALSFMCAFGLASCEKDSGNGGSGGDNGEDDQKWELKSVTTDVKVLTDNARAGVLEDNPTASNFLARYELGHRMTVKVDGESAEYKYERSRWYPAGDPIQYGEGIETIDVDISVKNPQAVVQDGTREQLLNADELIYKNPAQKAQLHLIETMSHANTLVELVFEQNELTGAVKVGNSATAYRIPSSGAVATRRYQAIIEPGAASFTCRFTTQGWDYDVTVEAAKVLGTAGATFDADKLYRIPLKVSGAMEVEVGQVTVEKWTDISKGQGSVQEKGDHIFAITGYEDQTIEVTFTDGTTQQVTLDDNGNGYMVPKVARRTIASIQKMGDALLPIGRREMEGVIELEVDAVGAVVARTAPGYDFMVGTVAEFLAMPGGAGTTGKTYAQDADIDFMSTPLTRRNDLYASYDGQNHKVENILINETQTRAGLFGDYKAGTISNLHIASGSVGSSAGYVGAIAGYLSGGASISNCTNAAVVSASGSYTGGIAGYIIDQGSISGCVNSGTVSGDGYVGGICGFGGASGKVVAITACLNEGEVTGSGNYTAGIVSGSYVEIIACANKANINGNNGVGGISAYFRAGSKMIACYNTGKITFTGNTTEMATGDDYGCAGLSARVVSEVAGCYNTGAVTVAIGGYTRYKGAIRAKTNAGYVFGTNYYLASVLSSDVLTTGGTAFSATAWPTDDSSTYWGVGTSGVGGYYWQDLYNWTSSAAARKYPKLYWEK